MEPQRPLNTCFVQKLSHVFFVIFPHNLHKRRACQKFPVAFDARGTSGFAGLAARPTGMP
jgi:hypothetical protein